MITQSQGSQNPTTIVLVHGAFADTSSWSKVISRLQAQGLNVIAVQNPTSSLAADVAAVNQVLDSVNGPVVLAGHSWGGVVITQAGTSANVGALVYVSAFAPSLEQSINDLFAPYPQPEWFGAVTADSAQNLTLSHEGIAQFFAPDLEPAEIDIVTTAQIPFALSANADKVTETAWSSKPSWFVLSEDDRIIRPDLQEKMASTIGARVTRVPASHLALLSKPDEVASVILDAAETLKSA